MADITGNQTVRLRMPVGTAAEIDVAKKKGVFGFDTTAGTVAVCPADAANFVRLGIHPADAPAATSLNGTDLVLIVQGGVLKRTTVADIGGGGVWQPLDSDLTAIAALTTASFGRSLLTMANAAAVRSAISAASTADLSGYQPLDSDLTEIAALTTDAFGRGLLPLSSAAAVRSYIGAGTVVPGDLAAYQPLDSDLTAIASLTTTAFGRSLLELVDGAAVRSAIGAGTSSFSGAYSALSGIPASIDAIDGLTPAADRLPYYTGASTGALATLTSFARTLLDDADASTARTTLGAAASTHDHTSITGSAAKLTTARSIAATGDAAWSVSFDGSAAVSAVLTLASTITAAGPVGSATRVPIITYDAKGRLTAVTDALITPAWTSVTGKPTTLSGYGVAATDVTAQALTGFVAGSNTAILATDSILAAFQKAQGQISARALASDVVAGYLPISNPAFTGRLSGNDVKIGGGTTSGWLQLVANNTGSGTFNVDFLGGASSNRRMTFRWSDANDTLIVMSSNDDGSARLDRVVIPRSSSLPVSVAGGFNVSTGDLSVGGVAVADSSRNGSFAGLTASGTISGPRATLSEFGVLRESVGDSTYGALYPIGVTPSVSNYSLRIADDGAYSILNAATAAILAVGGVAKATIDTDEMNLASGVELKQNGTTRITAGGDGRFASLRASDLSAATVRPATIGTDGTLGVQDADAFRTTIGVAPAPSTTNKNGNWSLDANTTTGILQTATGTLTLPAASATYATKSYVITASTTLTLTIAGTFCYLDANNSASYWYDTVTSVAFAMNGGHASGYRKKIEIWCDGQEWLVKC